MRRRNPTLTTSGGAVRETNLATLARRARGVLRVDVVDAGATATATFAMRNGDTIVARPPSVPVALRWLGAYGGILDKSRARNPRVTINGVEVAPPGLIHAGYAFLSEEYERTSGVDHYAWTFLNSIATGMWTGLGDRHAAEIRESLDEAVRRNVGVRWYGNHRTRAVDDLLAAWDRIHGGYNTVGSVRSPEGNAGTYYGDIVALYVSTGDSYAPTLIYETETETWRYVSFGDWVEAYEAEGGTVL
jgi:hypothetical protein